MSSEEEVHAVKRHTDQGGLAALRYHWGSVYQITGPLCLQPDPAQQPGSEARS